MGIGGKFFWATFVILSISVGIYSMLYTFNYYIIFGRSGMKRKGVFMEKNIPYDKINEFRFSNSFWDMGSAINLFGNPSAILIDKKYEQKAELKPFLEDMLDAEQAELINSDDS